MWGWSMDLCSTLGLVLLHMYMYGWNVYAWEKTRINYGFIFEFSPGTELHYREVLLICTALSSMLLGTMIVHIIASTKEASNYGGSDWVPLSITLVSRVSSLYSSGVFHQPLAASSWWLSCLVLRPCQSWTRGVSRCGLAVYTKKYLKAKEELWKFKYFSMQKYNHQKKSSKRNQNL
jgi:hypothetical protein